MTHRPDGIRLREDMLDDGVRIFVVPALHRDEDEATGHDDGGCRAVVAIKGDRIAVSTQHHTLLVALTGGADPVELTPADARLLGERLVHMAAEAEAFVAARQADIDRALDSVLAGTVAP